MEKLLTIVVPSYNTEQYIDECLPTLLDDRINDQVEILMVNDGSKDNTSAKAKEYQAKYPNTITVIDKENGGHGSTINKGIELASGKYFKVIDGDDWVNTEALVAFVGQLEDLDVDEIICPYEDHNVDTNEVKRVDFPGAKEGQVYDYDQFLETVDRLPMMHSLTIKTDILKDNDIKIDEHCFYVDMEYITLPMLYVKTAAYVNQSMYCYRLGTADQSVSPANFVKNRHMHNHVTKQLIRTYNKLNQEFPNQARTSILKKQLTVSEVNLDVNIFFFMDDLNQAKKEFLDYISQVKALAPDLYHQVSGSKLKLASFANGLFFKTIAKIYVKTRQIR